LNIRSLFLTDPSAVGLAIPSVLRLTTAMPISLGQLAECKSMLVSIERILEYANIIPEAAKQNSNIKIRHPHPRWPNEGGIRFDHVGVSYSPGQNVLQGINCHFHPQEKVMAKLIDNSVYTND